MNRIKFLVCVGTLIQTVGIASGQLPVCTPIGQLCTRTTDCCKGCCEAYSCIDRGFSCNADLIAQPGSETCARFYCPPEHICYLREICPPENPCPRAASCRKVDFSNNYTDYRYRNSADSFPIGIGMKSNVFIFTLLLLAILLP